MKIVACAIRLKNGCIVIMERPARHHLILNAHNWPDELEQGFLTDDGRIVNRKEALQIAKESNQIIRNCGGDSENLFSENLW